MNQDYFRPPSVLTTFFLKIIFNIIFPSSLRTYKRKLVKRFLRQNSRLHFSYMPNPSLTAFSALTMLGDLRKSRNSSLSNILNIQNCSRFPSWALFPNTHVMFFLQSIKYFPPCNRIVIENLMVGQLMFNILESDNYFETSVSSLHVYLPGVWPR
jgi:hypothetical protein